ncbi:MarR family winged helix-turn-helix transcriptional regulator [Actinoplanes sp. NPDC049596]|uniref:MarR family winged helix-turn-helix transcriptional regulator n=1 Tax=unclassified Actinoplanes TaxID=2626549 RepID=UPI00343389D0
MKEIDDWHQAVNARDLNAARRAVADSVLVSGPRGTSHVSRDEFAEWITRSGIELRPTASHPLTDHVVVLEQKARWPQSDDWTEVATAFRVRAGLVDAVLRFTTLPEALAAAEALKAGEPGQTLFEFIRHWSRRGDSEHGRDVQVTEAVHSLRARPEITVNDVAAELGLDQSGASRMIAHAEGYLVVRPSERDARRRTIAVTPAGAELLHQAHVWQEAVFAELTADWTDTERAEFQRAMRRLLDASRARLTAVATPGSSSVRRAAK